jgi:hypothetical protein
MRLQIYKFTHKARLQIKVYFIFGFHACLPNMDWYPHIHCRKHIIHISYIQHPKTSTAKEEVDEVVSRFRGQMLAEAPYGNREREEVVEGKKVPKGDYKRYLKIRALGATLLRTGKRKVRAAIETLYSNLN